MHILLTNDDGIHAPGLLALAQAMRADFRLTILAPDRNWSACGHVKTLDRPLCVREVELLDGTPALSTDGAPSDCVALALLGLVEDPVDLVVSGINPHANLGQDVTYSGTVMATMEAVIWGVPGIALSLDRVRDGKQHSDFNVAAQIGTSLARQLLARELPRDVLLNVNIPDLPLKRIRGFFPTRQGRRVYNDRLIRRTDPHGTPCYWIGGDAPGGIAEPGTDFWALAEGFVSITPLGIDLTAHDRLSDIESWSLKL